MSAIQHHTFFWNLAHKTLRDFLHGLPPIPSQRVAVLSGGPSREREISRLGGDFFAQNLTSLGHRVEIIDPSLHLPNLLEQIQGSFQGKGPQCVCNILHGPYGEDGTIQTVLNLLNLPYFFSDQSTSCLAMDKIWSKSIANMHGSLTPKGLYLPFEEYLDRSLFYPHVIKPNSEGSSFGVQLVHSFQEQSQLKDAWSYSENILVEEYIQGQELTVGIFNGFLLGITAIEKEGIWTTEQKYGPQGIKRHHPFPNLSEDMVSYIMRSAQSLYRAFRCKGLARLDYILTDHGDLHFLEANTQPGMGPSSLIPEMIQKSDLPVTAIVHGLLHQALETYERSQKEKEGAFAGYQRGDLAHALPQR